MSVESLKDTKQKIVEPKKMGPFSLVLQFFVLYLLDFLLT